MNNNNELQLKIFKNVTIRNNILSFIHREKVEYSFNETISLELLMNNEKFEILYDKLKNKNQIKINLMGLKKFMELNQANQYFKESFDLLWNQYNETIKTLNPLNILFSIKDADLFKFIYNKYYQFNQNNNNGFDQSYRLYDLFDQVFKKDHYFNKDIIKFLLEEINQINEKDGNESIEKEYDILELINSNKEILSSIYFNQKIPLFLNNNIDEIFENLNSQFYKNNYKKLFQLIKNDLNIDLEKEIKKRVNDCSFILCGYQYLDIKDFSKESLQFNYYLMLYGQYDYKISLHYNENIIHLDNLDFIKLFLLNRIQDNQLVNFRKFKQFLINNQNKLNSFDGILELVKIFKSKNNITIEPIDFFYYFDIYLIYHFLLRNDIQNIEYFLNLNLKNEKKSNQEIQLSIYYLLFNYSIKNFSIEIFQLFNKYNKDNMDFYNYSKEIIYQTNPSNQEIDKNQILIFINYLISNFNHYLNDSNIINEILKIIILNFNGEILEIILLNFSNSFKNNYISLLSTYSSDLFYEHFKSAENQENELDYKKINLYLNHCHLIQKIREPRISLKKLKVHETHIGKLFNHLLKYSSLGGFNYDYFITSLYDKSQFKNIDLSISIYKNIDQVLLENRYHSIQLKNPNISQFYFNKSNILLYNLLNSIDKKDIVSINKILSVINNESINISNIINNNDSCLEIVSNLFLNNYLNKFDLNWLLFSIIKKFKPSNQYISNIIPKNETELRNYFNEQNLISIKLNYQYFLNQENIILVNFENEKKFKKLKGNQEYNKFLNYFINGYYQKFLDYLEINKNDDQFLNKVYSNVDNNLLIKIEDKILKSTFSIEWFKKLFGFISIYIETYEYLLSIASNNSFEIFEFLLDNVLLNDLSKKKFILELFNFKISSTNIEYHQLMEFVLREKRELIEKLDFNQSELQKIHRVVFSFGNLSIFIQLRNIFKNSYHFQITSDLFLEFLFFNLNSYNCCDFIEYLYCNNYLNNLRDIITINNLKNFNINDIIKNNNIRVSKSTFILIHKIIKLQE